MTFWHSLADVLSTYNPQAQHNYLLCSFHENSGQPARMLLMLLIQLASISFQTHGQALAQRCQGKHIKPSFILDSVFLSYFFNAETHFCPVIQVGPALQS